MVGEAGEFNDNLTVEFKIRLKGDPKSSRLDNGKEKSVTSTRFLFVEEEFIKR